MTELIEFDDFKQVQALLKAGMELKFELAEDSDVLVGSPVYASALNRLREGLITGLRSGASLERARVQEGWYRLSGHPRRLATVARRAAMHPRWQDLDAVAKREWIETLAAPLAVDEGALESVVAAGGEIIDTS